MDGFANILKLLKGCRSAFSLIIIIFAVLLFEQYTDYFRLLRLEMISNIESKCRYVGTEVGVQRQVRKGLDAIIFPQKADSFWQRLLAGIIPASVPNRTKIVRAIIAIFRAIKLVVYGHYSIRFTGIGFQRFPSKL